MSARVVMVDDEETLVWSTAKQMKRERPDIAFDGVSDPRAALERVKSGPVDLLITDVRMPQMSGIELILAARAVAPSLPVIVITAYGTPEVREEVARRSVEYLEKPFAFPALLAVVDRCLMPSGGFSGAISIPMLPDLIQLYALSRARGSLRIARGAELGAIWFDEGAIAHAECDGLKGADAVYRLLTWQGGTFSMAPGAEPPARTIQVSWQELLVEGCRLMDESQRDEAAPASVQTRADGAAALDDRVAALWRALEPTIREVAPQSLVLALTLGSTEPALLQGEGAETASWGQPVAGVIADAARLTGGDEAGTLELVGGDAAVSIAWNRGREIALVFGETFAGSGGASRFRSNVVRLKQSCPDFFREA